MENDIMTSKLTSSELKEILAGVPMSYYMNSSTARQNGSNITSFIGVLVGINLKIIIMNELTFDELRQIDGGSYEEGRELGHKIGKAFYGACAMYGVYVLFCL